MIAVETNMLVYTHREDSPWHDAALAKITALAEAKSPWAISWPCILAIVTHPRIYSPPTHSPLPSIKSKPGLSRRVWFSWRRLKATGRSFARRLSTGASAVLKSMMLVSPRSAAIMASGSCGLRIGTSAASRHSPLSIRSSGKGRDKATHHIPTRFLAIISSAIILKSLSKPRNVKKTRPQNQHNYSRPGSASVCRCSIIGWLARTNRQP